MSTYGPFNEGDRVIVQGPTMSGQDVKRARTGTIEDIDENDPVWHYYVRFDKPFHGRDYAWFEPGSCKPALTVPKFKNQAEADAWLEAHS